MEQHQRLVICILGVRGTPEGRRLLLQRRHKVNEDTPYDGYIELPQGKVEAGESLVDAARRELREEAKLELLPSSSAQRADSSHLPLRICGSRIL